MAVAEMLLIIAKAQNTLSPGINTRLLMLLPFTLKTQGQEKTCLRHDSRVGECARTIAVLFPVRQCSKQLLSELRRDSAWDTDHSSACR